MGICLSEVNYGTGTGENLQRKEKALLKRLKERIKPKMKLVYLAAFLSWVQFLMRIISFYLIAKGFVTYYEGGQVDLVRFVLILLGLNAFGYGVALIAKRLQGLGSQFARDSLKQSFFEALLTKDGQFESKRQRRMSLTSLHRGLIVWILIIPTTWHLLCGPSSTVRRFSCWSF